MDHRAALTEMSALMAKGWVVAVEHLGGPCPWIMASLGEPVAIVGGFEAYTDLMQSLAGELSGAAFGKRPIELLMELAGYPEEMVKGSRIAVRRVDTHVVVVDILYPKTPKSAPLRFWLGVGDFIYRAYLAMVVVAERGHIYAVGPYYDENAELLGPSWIGLVATMFQYDVWRFSQGFLSVGTYTKDEVRRWL